MNFNKFETRLPSHQTAIDIFKDHWLCDLNDVLAGVESGTIPLFGEGERRPALAAQYLGKNGSLKGMRILELGPLEAAHTYHLEKLEAECIVSVEANAEAFLKCLIVKELLNLKASFLFGDFVEYLSKRLNAPINEHFDIVFCSGVLYHMPDPLHLIELISQTADCCFVWTHYYKDGLQDRTPEINEKTGFKATYWVRPYGDTVESPHFMGGNQPVAAWLSRDELLSAFHHFGYRHINVVLEETENELGPHIGFAASKQVI